MRKRLHTFFVLFLVDGAFNEVNTNLFMSKNLTRLRSFMSDEFYAKVMSYLPQDFDIDQFTLSFIQCFPDEGMKNLVDCSYKDIKESLQQYVMTQTVERLHLAKRIGRYDTNSERIDENYWTKDLRKERFRITKQNKTR